MANNVHGIDDHWSWNYGVPDSDGIACVTCHLVIPHGGKVSRLIVTKDTPAPYNYFAGQNDPRDGMHVTDQMTWFVKKPRDYYSGGTGNAPTDCGSSCVGWHSRWAMPAGAETW
jgi:hypothetical protein